MSRTREALYQVWASMRYRCRTKKRPWWNYYGRRGISVDIAWSDYEVFREWCLANGYRSGLQLDRRDNDKGYGPDNCRWVTPSQNQSNKRNNIFLEIDGEKLTLKQAVDKFGVVRYHVAVNRVNRGWSPRKAATTPPLWRRASE